MSENKNSLLVAGAILIGFMVLAAVTFFALKNINNKVATIDMSKVLEKSQLGQQVKKDVENKGKELQAKIQLAKTNPEKNQISYEFEKYKNDKLQDFSDKVKKITADIAKQKGIKAVSRPDMYIYCEEDLTDTVVKQLDK